MNKVNPSYVRINWPTKNISTQKLDKKHYSQYDNIKNIDLEAVSESIDGINSKELIDMMVDSSDDSILIGGVIIGELERLFANCFVGAEMASWSYNTPTRETMKALGTCIGKIIEHRWRVSNDIVYITRYKIKYLFDVNKISNTSKEALRLIGFIEYFIEMFTDPKRVID